MFRCGARPWLEPLLGGSCCGSPKRSVVMSFPCGVRAVLRLGCPTATTGSSTGNTNPCKHVIGHNYLSYFGLFRRPDFPEFQRGPPGLELWSGLDWAGILWCGGPDGAGQNGDLLL